MNAKDQKFLLIVESPTKAITIQKYLPSQYMVIASVGHVRQIESKAGSVTLKDGEFHFKWTTDITKINKILALAKKSHKIILATDMDREGEAIAYHLLNILQENNINTNNYERICFTEITQKAILESLKHPRLINNNLVNAQLVRSGLDYIMGYTLSPMLWSILKSFGNKQSAGRVQSVALRLLAEKELERKKFNSNKYYSICGVMFNNHHNLEVDLKSCDMEYKILNSLTEQEALAIYDYIIHGDKKYKLKKINKDIRYMSAQAPFTTSTLQQEASTQLHQSIDQSMKNAQKLYELGYITYHRSDSTYMSEEALKNVREYIGNKYKDYLSPEINKYDKKSKNSQEAHECIRPTNINTQNIEELDKYHNDLYQLIRNKTLESQMKPAQQENTGYIFSNDQDIEFTYRESHIIFPSFYMLYDHDSSDLRLNLQQDTCFELKEIEKKEHNTKPPKRYSEASLIKQLETLGIGRPSTMANIFKVLKLRDYIEYKARSIEVTFKGLCNNAFLSTFFANYIDFNFTSEMENKLDDIVNGLDFTQTLEFIINKLYLEVNNIKRIASNNCDENIVINPPLYNEDDKKSFSNVHSREDMIRKMGDLLLINKCDKCQGKLLLNQTYYFFSVCEKCDDNVNLQIESHAITEEIQIINNGKYRYVQMGESKVYLPDCIDNNLVEQDIKNISQLASERIYNGKKFIISKTFRNFFICNEDKQYFNFNDVIILHAALNLNDTKEDEFLELKDYIYNNVIAKPKYIKKSYTPKKKDK